MFLGIVALAAACKEKPAGPSPEFVRAQAALEATMSETMDPSYGDPAFDDVEALMRAVPPAASDHETAKMIADDIAKARDRQRALVAKLLAEKRARPIEIEAPPPAAIEEETETTTAAPQQQQEEESGVRQSFAEWKPKERDEKKKGGPVVMYTTVWCGVCTRAKEYLREVNVPFEEKDIEADEDAHREALSKLAAKGLKMRGVPVIDIGGTLVQGFSRKGMEDLLKKNGNL